jgi:hypothetical protein
MVRDQRWNRQVVAPMLPLTGSITDRFIAAIFYFPTP